MKKTVWSLGLWVTVLAASGCSSTPSKEDVCGGCTDPGVKQACEDTYDACEQTGDEDDCIEALDDSNFCD